MHYRTKCLFCGSPDLAEIINLGMHPFADTFVPWQHTAQPDKLYPLICDLCLECGNVQLRIKTNPLDRYQELDYSYTSSNSKFARDHWDAYAREVFERTGRPRRVLEIGSNDGYLAEQFQKLGATVTGIDASPAMTALAQQRNITAITGLFGESEYLKDEKFDLICANNVFNHSDHPLQFAEDVAAHLAPNGVFVFELPYWAQTIRDGKFDQIYHEHVTYLTVTSAKALFRRVGLRVFHVEWVDYHGGSIRVYVGSEPEDKSVSEMIVKEILDELFVPTRYARFMTEITRARNAFVSRIFDWAAKGSPIYCVGAAAKANTFLNFYRLDASVIRFITDASPHKIGKYTPGTRIPVVGDQVLARVDHPVVIITSWNLSDTLEAKLREINDTIIFTYPFVMRTQV